MLPTATMMTAGDVSGATANCNGQFQRQRRRRLGFAVPLALGKFRVGPRMFPHHSTLSDARHGAPPVLWFLSSHLFALSCFILARTTPHNVSLEK